MTPFSYPKLELKYCERCGGLWLRPQGGQAVYCAGCAEAIRELPPVGPRGGTTPSGAVQSAYVSLLACVTMLPGVGEALAGACL